MKSRLFFAVMLLTALCASSSRAELLWVNLGFSVYSVDSAAPGALLSGPISYSGTVGSEGISAIDIHPSTGVLYGYSHGSGRLYTLDKTSGAATLLGTAATTVNGWVGMTFEGTTRVRVVHIGGSQFTVDPATGTVLTVDTPTAEDGLVGIAHDAATATTYGIEDNTGRLYRIGSLGGAPFAPGTGVTEFVGTSGIFSSRSYNMDISAATGMAYVDDAGGGGAGTCNLWTIDLVTGVGSYVGALAFPFAGSKGIAVDVVPEPASLCGFALVAMALATRRSARP